MVVSSKRPNLWQPGPNQAHRMVSQSVPSGTVLHNVQVIANHRQWCRPSVPSEQLSHSDPSDGIAEASQPWQPDLAWHDCFTQPTQVSPERPRPKSDCPDRRQPARDNLAHPSHGIAETSRAIRPARSMAYQPHNTVPRMVSQKRPKGLATHVRMTLARPKDQSVTGVSRGRQRPP